MDYPLFFNHLSTPARDPVEAYSLLFDTFQGVLCLNQGDDRFFLYFDGDNIGHCTLATDFTFNDFKSSLKDNREVDLLAFIDEMEDKSPAFEYIEAEDFEKLSRFSIYIENRPYVNMDIIGHAWLVGGTLISLSTEPFWSNHIILFNILVEGATRPDKCQVYNVACKGHSNLVLLAMEKCLTDLCPLAIFTDEFIDWYNLLKKEDRTKTKDKVVYCYDNNFQLGRPTIDTLDGSAFPNMKEIIVGNAHAQNGKIRILFALDSKSRANIFVGFIKHSNDYTDYIRVADRLFKEHEASIDAENKNQVSN